MKAEISYSGIAGDRGNKAVWIRLASCISPHNSSFAWVRFCTASLSSAVRFATARSTVWYTLAFSMEMAIWVESMVRISMRSLVKAPVVRLFSMGRTNWVVIGDVSGHGVAAGLVMMMVQTAIQVILKNTPDLKPAALLSAINETIYHNIRSLDEDKYMTLTVFAVHENGRIDFSGLHQDIMIYRAAFDDVALIETRGFWIGITRDIRQMVTDDSFHMAVGDTLLIFTDGITEAVSNCSGEGEISDNRVFGDARLKSVFKTLGHLNPDNIKDGILQALENYECRDDVTMVILKRTK